MPRLPPGSPDDARVERFRSRHGEAVTAPGRDVEHGGGQSLGQAARGTPIGHQHVVGAGAHQHGGSVIRSRSASMSKSSRAWMRAQHHVPGRGSRGCGALLGLEPGVVGRSASRPDRGTAAGRGHRRPGPMLFSRCQCGCRSSGLDVRVGPRPAVDHHQPVEAVRVVQGHGQAGVRPPAAWPTTWARVRPRASITVTMSSPMAATSVGRPARVRTLRPVPRWSYSTTRKRLSSASICGAPERAGPSPGRPTGSPWRSRPPARHGPPSTGRRRSRPGKATLADVGDRTRSRPGSRAAPGRTGCSSGPACRPGSTRHRPCSSRRSWPSRSGRCGSW